MARTFPRTLHLDDVKSDAERKVFESLRDQLPDEWSVFHSASVIYRDHADGARDDEGDFVLCHPERGIISLEVKGGGLDCRHGEWSRIKKGGGRERTKDPFQQAIDHCYALKRKIREVEGWEDHELFLVHALSFPDLNIHRLTLAPDAPPEIVLDRTSTPHLAAAIDRVLAYHEGSCDKRALPGPDGEAMLEQLLAPTFTIEVPMATLFEDEERAMVELTGEQAALLNRLGRARRMAVTGCAGSGKTMVAIERARQLAEAGRKVLFVCFNKALCKHLQTTVKADGLEFSTFHGLCVRLAQKAGVALPSYPMEDTPPTFFTEELPLALMEAAKVLGGQYDDILVDEAQDLHNEWLEALTDTLIDGDDGSIWLFLDDNQRVYDAHLEVPDAYVPYDLTVNCRNTQAIHAEVIKLYAGVIKPEVKGPPGRQPAFVKGKDQGAAVARVLEDLCGQEDVSPRDIVVLSGHGREHSEIYGRLDGRWRLTDKRGRRDRVFFSSIRGFKGLESPVVVLCELDNLDEESQNNQIYVGMSRARNHCVVVAPEA